MHSQNDTAPVGVVPRRRAQAITPLMSDSPDRCTVAPEVEPGAKRNSWPLQQSLSGAAAFGIVATALEWLKLTR